MTVHVLHYSDVENAFDDPERIGRLAGLLRERRDESTIVCGTGDTLAPGLLSMETGGEHVLPFFETVGTDVATVGNHDFDVGVDALRSVIDRSPQTWLVTNLLVDGGDSHFGVDSGTRPLATATGSDETVGLFGVTDPGTLGDHPAAEAVRIEDPVVAARDAVTALRRRGVDRVVALSHAGAADDEIADVDGVDLVLGGHLHDVRSDRVGGTPVVHPGQRGEVVPEITVTDAGIDVTLHDVTAAPVDADVVETYRERFAALGLDERVAEAPAPIERGKAQLYPESTVGNVVADAYRWVADADVATFNALLLRSGSSLSGRITVGDLRALTPFDNEIHSTTLDGDELLTLLGNLDGPDGADLEVFAHVSGASLTWRRTDDDLELVDASVDGAPIDPAATYTVAAPTYAFVSGLFPPLAPDRRQETYGHQQDAIVGYVRNHGVDVAVGGRMTAVEDTASGELRSLR